MPLNENEIIFYITYDWVQQEALRYINRKLTDEELYSVKKGIEAGLLFDIDTVFEAAITNAVELSGRTS
jgi:hypothetical protein